MDDIRNIKDKFKIWFWNKSVNETDLDFEKEGKLDEKD